MDSMASTDSTASTAPLAPVTLAASTGRMHSKRSENEADSLSTRRLTSGVYIPVSKSPWWYGTAGTMNRSLVSAPSAPFRISMCTGEMSVLSPIAARLSENGTTHNVRVDLSAIAMYGNKRCSSNVRSGLRMYPTAPTCALKGPRAPEAPSAKRRLRLCMNKCLGPLAPTVPTTEAFRSPECTSHGTLVLSLNVATSAPENATRSKYMLGLLGPVAFFDPLNRKCSGSTSNSPHIPALSGLNTCSANGSSSRKL